MIALSYSSYDLEDFKEAWIDIYPQIEFIRHKKTDTDAILLANDELAIIVTVGTDHWKDWAYHLKFLKKEKETYGKIHQGFQLASHGLLSNLRLHDWLKEHKDKTIYATGHSKGAAVSIELLRHLAIDEIFLFGCPKIGNKKYSKGHPYYDKIFFFRNKYDIITRLPPGIFGYRHIELRKDNFVKLNVKKNRGHSALDYLNAIAWHLTNE